VRTIYEKEALFENLDAAFAELKEYIVSAVNKEELHPVEQQMFGRLQQMGRRGLEAFVTLSGSKSHFQLKRDSVSIRRRWLVVLIRVPFAVSFSAEVSAGIP